MTRRSLWKVNTLLVALGLSIAAVFGVGFAAGYFVRAMVARRDRRRGARWARQSIQHVQSIQHWMKPPQPSIVGRDEQAIREYIKNQEREDMRLEKPPQPSTVGRDEQAIREYIKNQEQEDMRLEQMMHLWR
jgi:hypothetical protein